MLKEFIVTICVILLFGGCVYFLANLPSRPLQYRTVKTTIDSISVEKHYGFLTKKIWTYHTKYGATLTSENEQTYKLGDTVVIKLVKTNQ